ncbi:efflux RND transporter permease subunit [Oricola cellulosilytica]|uniref:Efflux RND transporter permease subunit n=1 Tax=Oricola cellulosilytica TaxID=1429082 RepID=A0A4R0PAB7_9HYPH|nr:efflux RND transporter permease subunit [Oricola cellulosilytica]TCD14191.1 efflux RND transporter permease subunit [Oricola cellulosilytica]
MFRFIVGTSLKFRFILLALSILLLYAGYDRLQNMPVDVFPEFAPPIVEIQTPSLGMSPKEVEELVTVPLEDALAGLPELDAMRSKSVPQLSAIKLYFKRGTDLLWARQIVQERVDIVAPTLPTWSSPPFMLQPLSATSRVMKIGLASKEHSVIDLSMMTYWKINPRLQRVPGVAHVAIWGERLRMQQVQVDPRRLRANDVTLEEVMQATSEAVDVGLLRYSQGSVIGKGGYIDTPNQRLDIQHVLPVVSTDQLAEAVVKTDVYGNVLRLKDVAEVVEDHQPMIGDGIVNDEIGLLLIVEKFPWANTLDVTRGVEEALDALKPGLPGVEIDSEIFRPATFIEMAIDNLTKSLLVGAALVVIVLFAFLQEWRVALISIVAIPLSLVAAGLVLYFMGVTMNTMVLAGMVIALGAVVDDAIIDVENIMRRLREARAQNSSVSLGRIVLDASVEIRSSIVYATLIIALAVVPVFFLTGLSGSFFKPLALAYILSILASLVVASTVTPALCMVVLSGADRKKRNPPILTSWLQARYTSLLERILKQPRYAYGAVGALAFIGIAIYPLLGQQLLPSFKERDFLMHWVTEPGTSHQEMNRITIQSSKELRAIPGVRNFGAHIGQALLMDEVVGMHFGENWVSVDPSAPYSDTIDMIQEVVDGYPGLYRDVLTYLRERIKEVLTGASESIVVRIFGPDLNELRTQAEETLVAIEGIPGLMGAHVAHQKEIPNLEIQVDLDKAQRYGLKPGDVRRATSTLIAGIEVGDIYAKGETYDVQVWSVPAIRSDVTDIKEMMIDTPNGDFVPLSAVADVRIAPVTNVIKRELSSRYIDVEANVDDDYDLLTVANQVKEAVAQREFPLEYRAELIGEYKELNDAKTRLLASEIVALAGVLVLLQAAFNSWRLAVLAFFVLPTALVGGVLAALAAGGTISLGSLVGFITVLGISARNGILLISHYQHLQAREGMSFGRELVIRGARERLAPILMTAITTGIALLPLVVAGDIAGHEIEYPMATVILGGLIAGTLVNLFVMPSLFWRFGELRQTALSREAVPA